MEKIWYDGKSKKSSQTVRNYRIHNWQFDQMPVRGKVLQPIFNMTSLKQFFISALIWASIVIIRGLGSFRGYICDHCMSPSYVQPIGSVFTILGLVVLGPAPYLPHNPWIDGPNHMSTTVALCFMGIGTAALLVRFLLLKLVPRSVSQKPEQKICGQVDIWTYPHSFFISPSDLEMT